MAIFKNIIEVVFSRFRVLISLCILLSACSGDVSCLSTVDSDLQESALVTRLQDYNVFYRQSHPATKSARGAMIAATDVIGVMNGSSDGGSVGFWAGAAFGNPPLGKLIGTIVGALLYGGAYSYIAYIGLNGESEVMAESLYEHTISALCNSDVLLELNIDSLQQCVLHNGEYNLIERKQVENSELRTPEEYSDAQIIASGHNSILTVMIEKPITTKSQMSLCSGYEGLHYQILFSDELKESFMNDFSSLVCCASNDSLLSTCREDKASIVMDLFLELQQVCVNTVEDVSQIGNYYIDCIMDSQELTNDEKMYIVSSINVAESSTNFWTNQYEKAE